MRLEKQTLLRLLFFTLLLSVIVYVGLNYRDKFDLSNIQATVAQFGIWGPLIFMLLYIAATVLFMPGAVLTLAGGLIFGPVLGTVFNLTAATIGASIAFLIARYLASDWVIQKSGGKLKNLIAGVEKDGWKFVAIVRLVPLFPFNLLNYTLGLTRIRFWEYAIASFVFMLPGAFAYTYVGSLGQTALAGETKQLVTRGLVAVGLLVLVGSIPWLIKRLRGETGVSNND